MKIYKNRQVILGLLTISLFLGCVKDKDFSTPTVDCVEPEIFATNTIQQVKDMYTFGSATVIETDVIIEGYVVSSDKSGNIYKTISIQDKSENPTSAIKISIDETNLYTTYDVGRKIYIKLKGLAVGYSFGSIQIGQAVGGELARISAFEVKNHIFRSCEVAEIIPKKVTISDLNESMLEMLIEIENVQFKTTDLSMSYANVDDTETVNRVLENFNSSCNLVDEVLIRNSGFSKFKNQLLPEGKGSIIAVFSNFYDDFQLYIRDTDDVKFTEERCDYLNALTPTISISEVKQMYQGTMVEFGVDTNYIIEGFVVSSDEYGNFKEKLVLQDAVENPTTGIQFLIDKESIFEDYAIGDKVFVKLNKLYMAKSDAVLTIGFPNGTKISKIEASEVNRFIYKSEENFEIIPTEISISEVQNPVYENTLVRVLDVQLVENELGKSFTFFTGNDDGTRTLETCLETTKLTVFTDGDATFAHELFPEGHGTITGILSTHLEIRNTNDVKFTEERCDYLNVLTPTISISEVKQMYQGAMVEFGLDTNYIIEGFVVSSDEYGNFKEKLVLQDAVENPTSGIQLLIDKEAIFEDYAIGDKVFVKLNKLYMAKSDGILTIGFPNGTKISKIEASEVNRFIYTSEENFEIIPTEISISEVQNPLYENTLVRVLDVQLIENELGKSFTFFTGNNDGTRTLETCLETTTLTVFTDGDATFAHELFPEGHGKIEGVLSTHLEIRNINDVQFSEPFESCPIIIPKIMITEVADPKNDVSARFIELYNAGDSEINLTGWKLNKYTNGATTVSSSPIELNGNTIPVGSFVIIANTGYATIFNDVPTIESTYISGNGDDVYELVDNTGTTIDIFGVIGKDGNGTNWEYLDGRAVRNIMVTEPNPNFINSEWTIYSNASNSLITNPSSPQNAPIDFNPRVR